MIEVIAINYRKLNTSSGLNLTMHGHVPKSENARFAVCEVCNKRHKRSKELIKHYETDGVNIGMSLYI